MSSAPKTAAEPLDLSKWRKVPLYLVAGGVVFMGLGFIVAGSNCVRQFAYSWLQAFMFFLSLGLGSLFLILAHHLFDAGWSVPIRRFCEHIATLLWKLMPIMFLPIGLLAKTIYPWMREANPQLDHSLQAKAPMFTPVGFWVVSIFCFAVWFLIVHGLRHWSLEQDKTGAALATHKMRRYAGAGVVLYAITLTLAVVMWMKALEHEWFSTMYGVYYFAGSVWLTLATVYVITSVLDRQGVLTDVLHEHQYYFIGSLMFAFTVFYAYVTFAQYFIIWNGNMPEETFWYVVREKGSWWYIGMVIIFGHFFVPFLALLRIDVKNVFNFMLPLCIWAWLMHFVDLSFNIMPVLHPDNFVLHFMDIGCWAFFAGIFAIAFLREYRAHPPYPLKDPRLIEAMGYYHPVPTQISGGELDQTDDTTTAPRHSPGGKR
jgi:hypothetical protein